MPRGSNPKKIEEWRSRLQRFEDSQETVALFCQHEGVSAASLYLWKRKLRERCPLPPTSFQSVRVVSPLAPSPQGETVVQLGNGIHIQLGSDLPVVEAVMRQLLAAILDSPEGAKSC